MIKKKQKETANTTVDVLYLWGSNHDNSASFSFNF